MSWPQWSGANIPPAASAPPVLNPAPPAAPPPGHQYTTEQWSQLQQQNWNQWAQWQQQYQQWHQQYGAEYQKSINAMAQPPNPALPNIAVPPPLPNTAENKPPLPADDPPSNVSFSTMPPLTYSAPPPPQPSNFQRNNPTKPWPNPTGNRFNDFYQNKREFDSGNLPDPKRHQPANPNWPQNSPIQALMQQKFQNPISPLAKKESNEELSEAEIKFDKQFAEWEAQFNKWKDQNAEHPDKEQYKEYEKKWESWRAQLLERREQMKRKRLGLKVENKALNTNFSTPPPKVPLQSPNKPLLSTSANLFTKPPPNLNDEPLSFKPAAPQFPAFNEHQSSFDCGDEGSDFLKPMGNAGGIPGLDLVRSEKGGFKEEEVRIEPEMVKKGPDFDAISKGINNILTDQKLMNMLSLVSQNQNKSSDNLVNTTSRINPEKELSSENFPVMSEKSNQSYQSTQSEAFGGLSQREHVNNFDDQTRSSFTMAHNEKFEQNNQFASENNRFSNEPNFNFYKNKQNFGNAPNNHNSFDDFGPPPPKINRDDFSHGGDDEYNNYGNEEEEYYDDYGGAGGDYDADGNLMNYEEEDWGGEENYDDYNQENEHFQGNENFAEDEQHFGGNEDFQANEQGFQEDEPHFQDNEQNFNENEGNFEETKEEEQLELLKPETIIDYEHKSRKQVEPEVLLEPIFMFDYRHKPISRIPLPQRPKWLADLVRNIREFDPPLVRANDLLGMRRFPPPVDNWRQPDPQRWPERHRRDYQDYNNDSKQKNWGNYDRNKRDNDDNNTKSKPVAVDNTKKAPVDMDLEDEDNISEPDWEDFGNVEEKNESKVGKKTEAFSNKKNIVLIEDLVSYPGRNNRPPRIVIILRGPPGSGKTYLAKLIKDKEVENGGSAPRILSLDDYFMVEQEKEVKEDGNSIKIKDMVYEYEAEMEESYRASLTKSFKKTITDGYFPFIIVDNVNEKVKYFGEMWSYAKQNGFQVYVCQLDLDVQTCSKRNIHNRTESEIEKLVSNWEATPAHHPVLDASSLLQSAPISDVEMEEVNSPESEANENDASEDQVDRSKWDNFDLSLNNLAKLDGVNKPLRSSRTMEEYLQLDTEWTPSKSTKPGQKRVRWADLEEQREQEKMRAIGFVVGHTNWDRMTDPTKGGSALTRTKYIEKTGKYKVNQRNAGCEQ